ncbi:MAG: hypothetical protein J0L94_00600 [Rhodothermia bacterium]|nr:hypothetical protein [Rhodothermia bacterium]
MKTIITTVGTSLFNNYQKKEVSELFDRYYSPIDVSLKRFDSLNANSIYSEVHASHIEKISNNIRNWYKRLSDLEPDSTYRQYPSAEISSCIQIAEEAQEEDFRIHLIATDTLLSVLAAELITVWFEQNLNGATNIKEVLFQRHEKDEIETSQYVISKLSIQSQEEYEEGLLNYIDKINTIVSKNKKERKKCILNITGGYKALIPIATVYGQVMDIEIKYLFNDENMNIITIPQLPFAFNTDIYELFFDFINSQKIAEGKDRTDGDKKLINVLSNQKIINPETLEPTSIGKIIKTKIENSHNDQKTITGRIVELLISEHLHAEHKTLTNRNYNIARGLKFSWDKPNSRFYYSYKDDYENFEIDFQISHENINKITELTWIEVKPLTNSGLNGLLKQIKIRTDFLLEFKTEFNVTIFKIILYTISLSLKHNQQLQNIINLFNDRNIKYEIQYIIIPITKNGLPNEKELCEQKIELLNELPSF